MRCGSGARSVAAAAGVLATLLAGCTDCAGSAQSPARSTHAASRSPSPSPSQSPAPALALPSTPAVTRTSSPPSVVVVAATRVGAVFVSPSGNIACEMFGVADPPGTAQVRCDIAQHDYRSLRVPATCHQGFGDSFELDARASLLCHGDTVADEAALGGTNPLDVTSWFRPGRDPVVTVPQTGGPTLRLAALPYGSTLAYRNLTCASQRTGVHCRNTRTGGSFTVSRQAYRLH